MDPRVVRAAGVHNNRAPVRSQPRGPRGRGGGEGGGDPADYTRPR